MIKKIIVYCDGISGLYNCCNPGSCYGTSNIEPMIQGTDIVYENWTNDTHPAEVAKYGLDRAPVIILLQDNVILKKITGKNIDNQVEKLLTTIPWM